MEAKMIFLSHPQDTPKSSDDNSQASLKGSPKPVKDALTN